MNLLIADTIKKSPTVNVISYLTYQANLTQDVSDNLIGRMIKAQGTFRIVIIDEGNSLNTIESSIVSKKLNSGGNIILLSGRAIYSASIDGSLIVVESGLENTTSSENYEYVAVMQALFTIQSLLDSLKIKIIDPGALLRLLQKNYANHIIPRSYSIVNIQNVKKVIIGQAKDQITLQKSAYFPGNTTDPLSLKSKSILISIANGTTETYNLYQYSTFAYYFTGAQIAVKTVNNNNEIPGFQLELHPTDPIWYSSCFSKSLSKMGVAFISSY